MEPQPRRSITTSNSTHMLALPYPGRSHINAMLNLCDLLLSSSPSSPLLITFVVTDEWLGLLSSSLSRHPLIHFKSIPNVIPSEQIRAANFVLFLEAVFSKMETHVHGLIANLHPPPTSILADTYLPWAIDVGIRHSIPVHSFFPMSPTFFSLFFHHHLLPQSATIPEKKGEPLCNYVPAVATSLRFSDVDSALSPGRILDLMLPCFTVVKKAQSLLFNACYDMEHVIIDALREELSFPIYTVGPLIRKGVGKEEEDEDMRWLDLHPKDSVLYVSFGSFQLVSSEQMKEIAMGLRDSGVPFLWVARGEVAELRKVCGEQGKVVGWCEQPRVLCHPSVGGFLSHCGWNSTMEAVFAGKPVAAYPIAVDQQPNAGQLVEWGMAVRGKDEGVMDVDGELVGRKRIVEVVRTLMGLGSHSAEAMHMRGKARSMMEKCRLSYVGDDGSSVKDIRAFGELLLRGHRRPCASPALR